MIHTPKTQTQIPKTQQQIQLENLRSKLKKAAPKGFRSLLGLRDETTERFINHLVQTTKRKFTPYQDTDTSKAHYKDSTGDWKMTYFTIINEYLKKKKQTEKKRLQNDYNFLPTEAELFFKYPVLFSLLAFPGNPQKITRLIQTSVRYKEKYNRHQITKQDYDTFQSIYNKLINTSS